jgi:16S rRNA (cytosine967-C5)-methyltransferase
VAKQTEEGLYSYPQWWINKLKTQYPQSWQAILAVGNQHPPMTLRVNLRKTNPQTYVNQLQEIGVQAHCVGAQAVMLEKPLAVEHLLGFAVGQVSVQDYGAQHAASLLDLQDGMRVLDACCAPGGKTGHILELANVQLTALDNDALRLKRVASNLTRLGLEATLKLGDAATITLQDLVEGGLFDRILADVPCTASGIVRRHVDIKWLRRESDIVRFSAQQARILQHCWQLLAKGGKLLYVTCSVFHEENQAQIERFLVAHRDATQLALPVSQLEPSRDHDGLYYALLQKI